MTDSSILPGARATLISGQGITSPEFYRFFQAVAKAAGLTGDLDTQVKRITQIIQQIQENGTGRLLAGAGIVVDGLLSNGVATVSLSESGVDNGVYGDATHVPRLTVDQFGRVTHAEVVDVEGGFVPYFVPAGTVFRVPANKQALWTIPIELEGDAGLEIDGALVEVA